MRETTSHTDSSSPKPSKSQPFVDIASIGLRRGKRIKTPSQMLIHPSDIKKGVRKKGYDLLLMGCAFLSAITNPIQFIAIEKSVKETYNNFICNAYTTCDDFLEANFDGTQNSTSTLAKIYLSGRADNEVYTFKEMVKQPDKDQFEISMYKEVQSMFDNNIWMKVTRTSMLRHYDQELKSGKDIKRKKLLMIWTFKRKRHPDKSLSKYKARLCVHGGQEQHGIHFWDTFAPVVSWMSVRTLLVLSKIHNLHTKSIDFVQAYPQADIKVTIYLHTPQGVSFGDKHQDVVLQLKKNLYGLKDTELTW